MGIENCKLYISMFLKILFNLDLTTTNLINSIIPHNRFFDLFFSFFSLRGFSIVIWILIVLFLILFEETRDRRFIIYFLICFLTTGFLVNNVLKNIIQRPRPSQRYQIYKNANCPADYSFPSGHAATAFAAATALSAFHKKRKYFFYAVACLISLSRIYLHCHFFLDVLAGALIGYFVSKIILSLSKIKK